MPEIYTKIRDQYVKKDVPYDKAQAIAAATYNVIRKKHPSLQKLSNKKGAK